MTRRKQTGVALAMAMIVLIILTLLGVAAMRAARLELRLSNNSQSQLSALEQAQSLADTIVSTSSNISIQPGMDYFYCYSAPNPPSHPPTASSTPASPFSASGSCLSSYASGGVTYTSLGSVTLPTLATLSGVVNPLPNNTYAQVLRNDPEFVPASAVRGAETSGRSFDFASFTVMAGYDNTAPVDGSNNVTSASQPAAGASEVNEGLYVRHNKATGVTYQ